MPLELRPTCRPQHFFSQEPQANDEPLARGSATSFRAFLAKAMIMLLALVVCAARPDCASAGSITYTAIGSDSDGSLSAEAVFTLSANTVTVTLYNLQTNQGSQGQSVSGLVFMVGGPPAGGASLTLTSASGNLVTFTQTGPNGQIAPDPGQITYSGSTLSDSHWAVVNSDNLTALSGGKPNQMILGPASSDGNYDDANPGFQKNFNPYYQDSATFVLSAPGVTTASTISDVSIDFGTGPDCVLAAMTGSSSQSSAVPTPAGMVVLFSGGVCLLGFAGVRRLRRAAVAV
jgi:hypothetical protein